MAGGVSKVSLPSVATVLLSGVVCVEEVLLFLSTVAIAGTTFRLIGLDGFAGAVFLSNGFVAREAGLIGLGGMFFTGGATGTLLSGVVKRTRKEANWGY